MWYVYHLLYGLQEVQKAGAPLCPIVSSINSVTYECASHLADILGTVFAKTPAKSDYHNLNSEASVNGVKNLKVDPDKSLMLYDLPALFYGYSSGKCFISS